MADKHTATPLLLNGQAVCHIAQGKYEDAQTALQEALDRVRKRKLTFIEKSIDWRFFQDSNDSQTLVNLIVLSQLTAKAPEVANRYISQMKDAHANHPFVKDLANKVIQSNERVVFLKKQRLFCFISLGQ